jgi:hypothetical protein
MRQPAPGLVRFMHLADSVSVLGLPLAFFIDFRNIIKG